MVSLDTADGTGLFDSQPALELPLVTVVQALSTPYHIIPYLKALEAENTFLQLDDALGTGFSLGFRSTDGTEGHK